MTLREALFALALLSSAGLIVVGIGMLSVAAALVAAGVALGLFAWLVLSD